MCRLVGPDNNASILLFQSKQISAPMTQVSIIACFLEREREREPVDQSRVYEKQKNPILNH